MDLSGEYNLFFCILLTIRIKSSTSEGMQSVASLRAGRLNVSSIPSRDGSSPSHLSNAMSSSSSLSSPGPWMTAEVALSLGSSGRAARTWVCGGVNGVSERGTRLIPSTHHEPLHMYPSSTHLICGPPGIAHVLQACVLHGADH